MYCGDKGISAFSKVEEQLQIRRKKRIQTFSIVILYNTTHGYHLLLYYTEYPLVFL
jgi:hypothetical protein